MSASTDLRPAAPCRPAPTALARRIRLTVFGLAAVALAACSPPTKDLEGPVEPLGEFRLGYNIVNVSNIRQIPPTRNATPEEWQEAFTKAIDERFGRFNGSQLYHIGVAVDGYSLAPTGVPFVLNTQSVAVIRVWLYDDALGGRITEEPEQFTVFERLDAEGRIVGSGATQSREEQMKAIAENGARLIEVYMRKNPQWFEAREGAASEVIIRNNEVVRPGE